MRIPIHLSDSLSFTPVFYTFAFPYLVYHAARYIAKPFYDYKIAQAKKQPKNQILAEKNRSEREEAGKVISLMKKRVKKMKEEESNMSGLVIAEAWYGDLDNPVPAGDFPTVIDVTIPLAFLVESSTLDCKNSSTKSILLGFYDPCPGNTKKLWIRYYHKNLVHTVVIDDGSPFYLPRSG